MSDAAARRLNPTHRPANLRNFPEGHYRNFRAWALPLELLNHIGGTRSCCRRHRFEAIYSHQPVEACNIWLAAAACCSRQFLSSSVSKYRPLRPRQELHLPRKLSIEHKRATVCRSFLHSMRIPAADYSKSTFRAYRLPIEVWPTAVNRLPARSLILHWRKSRAAACLR